MLPVSQLDIPPEGDGLLSRSSAWIRMQTCAAFSAQEHGDASRSAFPTAVSAL